MTLRFDQPEMLWVLLLAVPVGWSGLAWLRSMSGVRRWVSVAVRVMLIALTVVMLAGATALHTTDRLAVVAVVDVSESVRAFVRPGTLAEPEGAGRGAGGSISEALRLWVENAARAKGGGPRGPEDLLGIVAFDGASTVVSAPTGGARGTLGPGADGNALGDDPLGRPLPTGVLEGTDIADALRLALAGLPPDARRRIVLLSDGNQTRGDALSAAREIAGVGTAVGAGPSRGAAARRGVPIDVVPLRYKVESAVVIERVDAPAKVHSGTAATVRVTLRSAGRASGVLRLLGDGREVAIGDEAGGGRRVSLEAGRRVEVLSVPVGSGRVHRFEAQFEPDAGGDVAGRAAGPGAVRVVNHGAQAVSVSPANGAVLFVDGVDQGVPGGPGETLARTLRQEGLEVEVVSPDSVPADMLQLQGYDLVILQNVAAHALGEEGVSRLVRFTTDLGGGLVVIGGTETLASGGFRGSALEPILPVKLELPEKLVVPAAAVMIVMDNSGSMGWTVSGTGRSQQSVANEGAALAIKSLDSSDLVGVLEFNSSYREVVPLKRNTEPDKAAKAVMEISPGGGTNLPPALIEAGRLLNGVEAKVKHIIVLSDGLSQGRTSLAGIAGGLAAGGVKVSAIAVGDQADAEGLSDIATAGGGAFYRVADPRVLPRVFLRAVQVVRTPLVREEPFEPVVVDEGDPLVQALRQATGEQRGTLPPLLGLALTAPRGDKTVVNPIVSPQGEPLLAYWQAGLGRVAVFTSDAHKWGQPWLDWPGYRAFWVALARSTSRQASQRFADATAETVGDTLRLRVEAVDRAGKPLDGLDLAAGVFGPRGERRDVRLAQTGPGVYEAQSEADMPGTYVATIAARAVGGGGAAASADAPAVAPMIAAATRSAGDEFRSFKSDDELLAQIAAAGGGRVLDARGVKPGELFERGGVQPRESRLPLWPWLLPWAVVLLLVDVAARRVAWDRLLDPGEDAMLAKALRRGGARAGATLASLRRTGERTDERLDSAATALSESDAEQLAEAQRLRRRGQRQQAWAAPSGGGGDGAAPATAARKPEGGEPPDAAAPIVDTSDTPAGGAGEGGLLAAKRRARERFEERDQRGAGGER